jgi:uncharacterized protein with PIN domain
MIAQTAADMVTDETLQSLCNKLKILLQHATHAKTSHIHNIIMAHISEGKILVDELARPFIEQAFS